MPQQNFAAAPAASPAPCAQDTGGNFSITLYPLNSHHSQFHIIHIHQSCIYVYVDTRLRTYNISIMTDNQLTLTMSLICFAQFTRLQSAAGSSQVPCTSVVVSSACRMSCRNLSHSAGMGGCVLLKLFAIVTFVSITIRYCKLPQGLHQKYMYWWLLRLHYNYNHINLYIYTLSTRATLAKLASSLQLSSWCGFQPFPHSAHIGYVLWPFPNVWRAVCRWRVAHQGHESRLLGLAG